MTRIERIERPGFEDVLVWRDEITPLTAIVAIHSTALGPAVGGTRWQPYASFDDALNDALRLSAAMTKKSAVAGLAFGGGKAIVIGDQNAKSIDQLRSYARFLNQLEGRFVTTTDVGTTTRELDQLRAWARHVAGLSAMLGGAGDTSGLTATTVLGGMRATFEVLDGDDVAGGAAAGEFAGRQIVVIGVGKVGSKVARRLAEAGAQLTIADIRADAAAELADRARRGRRAARRSVDTAVRPALAQRAGRRVQRRDDPDAALPRDLRRGEQPARAGAAGCGAAGRARDSLRTGLCRELGRPDQRRG